MRKIGTMSLRKLFNAKRMTSCFLLLLCSAFCLAAPPVKKVVTGKVLDPSKLELPGVTVVVKGQSGKGTITDINGLFSLQVDDAENATLAKALALYTYEADVVGLLLSATEPYSLYPPCVTACCNRPVIGIVTQIDHEGGDPDRAHNWLALAGCDPIFHVSSYTGEGIWQILYYLREPGDVLPWDSREDAERPRTVQSNKYGAL